MTDTTNIVFTLSPVTLARLLPYAHKEKTRYAMDGIAVSRDGSSLAATNGKICARIGDALGDNPIVIPADDVKVLIRDAKSKRREPERAITFASADNGVTVTATVHDADNPEREHGTRTFRPVEGYFPPIEDVYDDMGETTTFGLDFALLERMYKAAKAAGNTAGRVTVRVGDNRASRASTHVEFRATPGAVDSRPVEALIMPVNLAD